MSQYEVATNSFAIKKGSCILLEISQEKAYVTSKNPTWLVRVSTEAWTRYCLNVSHNHCHFLSSISTPQAVAMLCCDIKLNNTVPVQAKKVHRDSTGKVPLIFKTRITMRFHAPATSPPGTEPPTIH